MAKDEDEKKKKGPLKFQMTDTSILSDDEIAAIELEAEQEVEKTAKDEAKAVLKAKLVAKRRQAVGVDEPSEEVVIDLAPYCDRILLDNVAYLQGVQYTVRASVATVMREIMQRTWNHQAEIDGKSENFYRRGRSQRILPNGTVVNTSNLLRA